MASNTVKAWGAKAPGLLHEELNIALPEVGASFPTSRAEITSQPTLISYLCVKRN